jgi:hypothetical protein
VNELAAGVFVGSAMRAAAEGTHDCNRLVSAIGRLVVLSHPVPTLLDLLGFFLVDLGHFIASVA